MVIYAYVTIKFEDDNRFHEVLNNMGYKGSIHNIFSAMSYRIYRVSLEENEIMLLKLAFPALEINKLKS